MLAAVKNCTYVYVLKMTGKRLFLNICLIVGLSLQGFGQLFSNTNGPIKDALYLHNASMTNDTLRDCIWRPANQREICPDPDVHFILYTGQERHKIDSYQIDWIAQSAWDPDKEDIFIIHGYAGGDDKPPIGILRDAYIANGSYNVWVVDWGALGKPPCYSAAVHNMRPVAKCTGALLTSLRAIGLKTDRTTCIGHSLGAHVCGLISRNVAFRLHRIVALDPARPLIPRMSRLNSGHASAVHVMHTNSGKYGEMGRSGHVDFCINGGRMQPFCEDTNDAALCSHVWVLCYLAESINIATAKKAEPCARRCSAGRRPGNRVGRPVIMGQHTPLSAEGSYCLSDSRVPFCPASPGAPGDKRCCISLGSKRQAHLS